MCTNTLIATINELNLSRPATPERIRMDEMIEQVRLRKIYINEYMFMPGLNKCALHINIVGVTIYGGIKQ